MASLEKLFPGGIKMEDLATTPPVPLQPPEIQFRIAIADSGITPPDDIILDGKLRRFPTNDKRGDDSGWYVGYDGKVPAGAFGCWRSGIDSTWRADIGRELTHIEAMQHAAKMRELRAQREREINLQRETAAESAHEIWEGAPIASDEHPYLKNKGITNPGLKVATDGKLIAPMYVNGELSSLQMIAPDGQKRFLKGGKTGGAWWVIGGAVSDTCSRVYLTEGVATGASVFEATGKPVAIAYSANNLSAVAADLRSIVGPMCEIVIVADNDESGTGKTEADKAAAVSSARVIMPPQTGDANDYAQAGGDLTALLEPVEARPATHRKYQLIPANDLTELPPVKWQVKKLIPARDVVAIYGPPGAGKSFMALDIAAHIAEGRDWMGYKVRPAHVVYVVLEAINGFSARLKAWTVHNNRMLPDRFHIVAREAFHLSSPSDIAALVGAISEKVGGEHDGMIVFIDTMARALGTYEENSNDDMGRVVAACDAISKALSATVALIAHPGKDASKGMRGGSALLGGLDTVIMLEKDDHGIRTWKVEKQKEGQDGLSGTFTLKVVPVGIDEDGDEITSCVVAEDDHSIPDVVEESKALGEARQLFEAAVRDVGRLHQGAPFVSAEAWNEWTKTQPFPTDAIRRQRLSRAKKLLIEAGYVSESKGGYLATDHPAFNGAFIGLENL